MDTIGVTPRADLFYEARYAALLRQMVAHVIEVEGPIYDDVLVTRIARAHGFQRSGSNIQALVLAAVDRRFPRTKRMGAMSSGRRALGPTFQCLIDRVRERSGHTPTSRSSNSRALPDRLPVSV